MSGSPFTYFAFDLLTARLLGQVPLTGAQFGQLINGAGQGQMTLNLGDPRIQAGTDPINCTVPNRTLIVVDFMGSLVWGGVVMQRNWAVEASGDSTTRALALTCSEVYSYFQQRVQATDYSAPPTSGIVSPMALWPETPWDASLIICQILGDAIGYSDSATQPFGNPLGGMGLLLNGAIPNGAIPAAPATDWVAVTYPFTTTQTVDTIVQQLVQLGLGVGPDIGVDLAYSGGMGSPPVATINVSYPRRGRTVAQSALVFDYSVARAYSFPEDGTQTGNQVYEIGGSGAVVVDVNVVPLGMGYPLLERVVPRSNAQSQNIIALLSQCGTSDLAMYSFAPVVPTVTLSASDRNMPLGSFTVGDDGLVLIPELGNDGKVFDPRFPAGLQQEWQITAWQCKVPDEGDATVEFTLGQPPYLQALSPAI